MQFIFLTQYKSLLNPYHRYFNVGGGMGFISIKPVARMGY